jgi:hypothetical protein
VLAAATLAPNRTAPPGTPPTPDAAPATGWEGWCGGDGFPAVDGGICRGHERGEQPWYPVLIVAGQEPDDLEGVEARREHVRQGGGLLESRLDAACLGHGHSLSLCVISAVLASCRVCPRAGSRGLAHAEPDALRDLAEMVVGEPVAVAAELAGEGALAELFAPRGSVLVDGARIA